MNIEDAAAPEAALDHHVSAVAAEIHAAGGLETLTDDLAHFREVEAAIEPMAALLFEAAFQSMAVDVDMVMDALGLRDADGAARVRRIVERAVEDGEAAREVALGGALICDAANAATCRAEWSKWEAMADDDLGKNAAGLDIYHAARHIQRRLLRHDQATHPMGGALATLTGFRSAGLPLGRSAWRYARDGALAGAEDFKSECEAEAEHLKFVGDAVSGALAEAFQ